jgi:hypothetical protein
MDINWKERATIGSKRNFITPYSPEGDIFETANYLETDSNVTRLEKKNISLWLKYPVVLVLYFNMTQDDCGLNLFLWSKSNPEVVVG